MTTAATDAKRAAVDRIAKDTQTYMGPRRDHENVGRGWDAGVAYMMEQLATYAKFAEDVGQHDHKEHPRVTLRAAVNSLKRRMVEEE